MRKLIITHWPVLILIISAILLSSSLLKPGWYATHDGIFHIYRTIEAQAMLKLGEIPLRWAGNFDQGFGIPLFTFIYPLPYYISAALSLAVGTMWSLKITTIMAYLSGALGMYYLLKRYGRSIGLFGGLIYLMTPYQFLNIFVRGTIGEILAIGIIPWVLYSYQSLSSNRNVRLNWYHPIPLALLVIAHNFLGLLFAGFLFGLILTRLQAIKQSLLSLAISFGLASFFLIPMIMQRELLYSFANHDLTFRFDQHFVTLKQLLYGKWDYWYSVPGDGDGMSFQLGVAQLGLALLGSATILFFRRTPIALYLVFAYLGSIFLMHGKSYFVWEALPLLQSVQFPWRFLFMPLVLTPLLATQFLVRLNSRNLRLGIMIIFLVLAFVNTRNYRTPIKFFDNAEYTDLYLLYLNKTSTTFRTEILPRWSVPAERYKNDEVLVNSGNMTIDALHHNPLKLELTIHNKPDESEGRITILRNYYPGWIATVDGSRRIELTPTGDGMISMVPELGVHNYTIKINNTPLEQGSNILSMLSIISLGYLWHKNRKKPTFRTKSK